MPKKKAPPRHRSATEKPFGGQRDAQTATVDWNKLVEPLRKETQGHDLARHLLSVGKTMSTSAAHMFVLGEYLQEKKSEIPHGEFGAWIEAEGLARSTATKYMSFARRMRNHIEKHGPVIPLSKVLELVQGGRRSKEPGATRAQNATSVAISAERAPEGPEAPIAADAPVDAAATQEIAGTVEEPTRVGDARGVLDGAAGVVESPPETTPKPLVEVRVGSETAATTEDAVSQVLPLRAATAALTSLGQMDLSAVDVLQPKPLKTLAVEVGRLRMAMSHAAEAVEALATAVRERGLAFSHERGETGS